MPSPLHLLPGDHDATAQRAGSRVGRASPPLLCSCLRRVAHASQLDPVYGLTRLGVGVKCSSHGVRQGSRGAEPGCREQPAVDLHPERGAIVQEDLVEDVRDVRMPSRVEGNPFESPPVGLLDGDLDPTVNGYCHSRVAVDHCMFPEQDTLSRRESPRHGLRPGQWTMSVGLSRRLFQGRTASPRDCQA